MRFRACLAALLALALLGGPAGEALALGGQTMVLGRMAAPREGAPSVAATHSPRAHFVLHCAGCHGMDGAGSTLGQVPDLRRLGAFLRLPGGREFVLKVPGVMGSGLNDQQVAEVANWLLATLARESVPEGHRPFSTQEVSQARAQPLHDVAAERQRLMEQARVLGVALY